VVTSFTRPSQGSFKKVKHGEVTLYLSPNLRARGPIIIDVDGFWKLKRIVVIGELTG